MSSTGIILQTRIKSQMSEDISQNLQSYMARGGLQPNLCSALSSGFSYIYLITLLKGVWVGLLGDQRQANLFSIYTSQEQKSTQLFSVQFIYCLDPLFYKHIKENSVTFFLNDMSQKISVSVFRKRHKLSQRFIHLSKKY